METGVSPRSVNTYRSSNGCWTCRLRRKKCDEQHPVCDGCSALNLTCYYGQEKPDWMDGGVRQEEMAEHLKRKVKERGHRRFGNHGVRDLNNRAACPDVASDAMLAQSQRLPTLPSFDAHVTSFITTGGEMKSSPQALDLILQRRASCKFAPPDARRNSVFGQSDDFVLIMFYIDNVFPFLFPFYQPPLLQGGRAWVLEMMMTSPVVRQAALCQSSYFFSLSRGTANGGPPWDTAVLAQTREAFGVLRQALQVMTGSNITEHLHGAVRVMSSIMQVQRFEIAVLSFDNCQSHLNAALALFKQLLDSAGAIEPFGLRSSFEIVMNSLGPPSWSSALYGQLPSAEQAAFRFSSALLIFDDIIASTVLQEQPRLYEYHHSLLEDIHGTGPPIDLEAVVGCQNWALMQLGEIAAVDAWKQRCKRGGYLDMMELVRRATAIKSSLETHLARLQSNTVAHSKEGNGVFDVFTTDLTKRTASQRPLITLAWAHAALIYLSVVVSGWQTASTEIRYHVRRIIEVPVREITPPALLRTMVWPLCVAGCLAEPELATQLCSTIEALQPRSVFGTLKKALEVMESAWCNKNSTDIASRDLASCFRNQGDLVLLV
ncbi:fungal-specific transcription factor domain-containing protein [Xylariaceae sp. FL1651]|nr:fungal-specific transcription factor domain-containing protein [Xylariaceae sp. FL1651]